MHNDVAVLKSSEFNSIVFSFVSVENTTLLESKGSLFTDGYLVHKKPFLRVFGYV